MQFHAYHSSKQRAESLKQASVLQKGFNFRKIENNYLRNVIKIDGFKA